MSLSWPLEKTFCFPLYYYPLCIIVGWMIFYLMLKLLSCFQSGTKDSKKTKEFVAKQKEQMTQYLHDLTPLPVDIVNVILNQYLFDEEDKNTFWKILNKTIRIKIQINAKIYGYLCNLWCFIVHIMFCHHYFRIY